MKAAAVLCASLVCSQATIARDYANWMAELPDGAFLYTLSIPGSHDTMTGEGFITASNAYNSQTQTLTLADQISKGVRGLDLRPAIRNNQLWCNHGPHETNKSFNDAFNTLCDYLDQHPTEFFIMHLLPGSKGVLSDDYTAAELSDYLNALVSNERFKNYLIPFQPNLQVGHLRGKICLLPRYDLVDWKNDMNSVILHNWNDNNSNVYSFPNSKTATEYNNYKEFMIGVQDLAHTNGNALNQKVTAMKDLVDYTSSKCFTPNIKNLTWGINFLSAYTNTSISTADGYAENAERCNKEFIDYIERADYNPGPLGLVLADFVGAESHTYRNSSVSNTTKTRTTYGEQLVNAIIDNNFSYINTISPSVVAPLFRKVKNDAFHYNGFRGNLEFVDVNNNGKLDLIHKHRNTADSWNLEINLYNNDGNTLSSRSSIPCAHPTDPWGNDSKGYNRILVPIDYNRNGKVDVLNFGQHTWQYNGSDWTWGGTFILDNKGGSYEVRKDITSALYSQELHMHDKDIEQRVQGLMITADFDMNGRPEIVVFKRGNDTKEGEDDVTRNAYPTLFKNEGGTFYGANITLPEVADGTMAVGDFNNDGRPDFVITGRTSEGVRQIWLCLNTTVSEHQYSFNCQQLTGLSQYATIFGAIAAADLNNDGLLDLVITGETATSDHTFNILLNQGGNNFTAVDNSNFPGLHCSGLDICDLNGDGYADIAYQGASDGDRKDGAATGVLMNQGDGTFSSFDFDFIQLRGGGTIRLADYNRNGNVSLAVMGYGEDGFAVYDQMPIAPSPAAAKKAPARVNFADGADESSFKSNPYQKLDCTKTDLNDNQVKLSWESLGDEYSYNYIVKLKDGSMVYAVPAVTSESSDVTAGPRALLTGTTDQAIRSTSVTLNVKPSDVKAWGVHAIAPDRTTSLIYLDSNDVVTGIDGINLDENDADAPVEFYNLQGQRVVNPSNGIYIRRQGSNVTKVRI